jgi:hypothetical protein
MISMDADKKAQIQAHARAIAALLYEETDPEQVKTLAGIEVTVRDHLLEHVSPEIGDFLSKQSVGQVPDENVPSPVSSEG